MRRFLPILPIVVLAVMACRFSPEAAAPTGVPGAGSRVEARDLLYAESDDPARTSLDVYTVVGAEDRPVMIYVHGGAWSAGDKANVDLKDDVFLENGYVFVSVNYRLTPDVAFPTHARDVAAAVRWVYDNIAGYGGDPERLFLMGHSAGAHLVALVGTDGTYLSEVGLGLEDIAGVIPLDTQAYDIASLAEDGRLPALYREPFGEDPAFWASASPITHIAPGLTIPPFAIAYSGGSEVNPSIQRADSAEAFSAALTEAGIPNIIIPAPEKTHAEINRQFGEPGDHVTESVLEFLAPFAFP